MGIALLIYMIGAWVAFTLLYLVSYYFDKYTEQKGLNLGQGVLICLLSWVLVVILLIVYSDKYKFLLKQLFKRK